MSRNACNGKFGNFVEILPQHDNPGGFGNCDEVGEICQIPKKLKCELAQYTETGHVDGFDIFDKFGKILSNCQATAI